MVYVAHQTQVAPESGELSDIYDVIELACLKPSVASKRESCAKITLQFMGIANKVLRCAVFVFIGSSIPHVMPKAQAHCFDSALWQKALSRFVSACECASVPLCTVA